MNPRRQWQGMMTILRFNWPQYLCAALVCIAALAGVIFAGSSIFKIACGIAAAGAAYFGIVSLVVSHLIYDRSDLYRWRWLDSILQGVTPSSVIFCHTGFDETSSTLKKRLQPEAWTLLDHYDPLLMTEPSIRLARSLHPPPPETIGASFDQWPVESGSADLVLALLAVHEFREAIQRIAWFTEARRSLKPGGRIIIVEHLRNAANFIAFGPGFLHFHSRSDWHRCWEAAGLHAVDEFSITPWVAGFALVPSC